MARASSFLAALVIDATDTLHYVCTSLMGPRAPVGLPKPGAHADENPGGDVPTRRPSYLVQFNVTHGGMALGCSAYAAFLRTAAILDRAPSTAATAMWGAAVSVAVIIFGLLLVRGVFYPHLAKYDLEDNYRTPFYTAPAIVASGLAASSPPHLRTVAGLRVAFLALLAYQCVFALFWYGRWLFSPSHTLRRVRASYFMATTEFFLLGYLGALAGFDELGRLTLSVGVLFWGIILVTFFQFLGKSLGGRRAQPTLFLLIGMSFSLRELLFLTSGTLVAPPAGTAIAHMQLQFGAGRRVMDDFTWFFVAVTLFLYCFLIRLFRQYWNNKFSASWWAYIFPLSTAANLALRVANELRTPAAWIMAVTSAAIASLMILVVALLSIRAAINGELPFDEVALRLQEEKRRNSDIGDCEDVLSNQECGKLAYQFNELLEQFHSDDSKALFETLHSVLGDHIAANPST